MVKTRLSEVITSCFTRIIFQPMRNGSNVFIMEQLRGFISLLVPP